MIRTRVRKVHDLQKQHICATVNRDDHASRERYVISYLKHPIAAEPRLYDLRVVYSMLKADPKWLGSPTWSAYYPAPEREHVLAVSD